MKKDEKFILTLKGLLSLYDNGETILDGIELYMRRNGYNAIMLEDTLVFRKIEMVE